MHTRSITTATVVLLSTGETKTRRHATGFSHLVVQQRHQHYVKVLVQIVNLTNIFILGKDAIVQLGRMAEGAGGGRGVMMRESFLRGRVAT